MRRIKDILVVILMVFSFFLIAGIGLASLVSIIRFACKGVA